MILNETEIAATQHRRTMDALLRHYAESGATLSHIADERITGLSLNTLKKHARRLGLAFPDYTPRTLRAKS